MAECNPITLQDIALSSPARASATMATSLLTVRPPPSPTLSRRCGWKRGHSTRLRAASSRSAQLPSIAAPVPEYAPSQPPSDPTEQLEYETGLCQLNRPYSPAEIKRFCLANPKQMVETYCRGAEVVTKVLLYSVFLVKDGLLGGEVTNRAAHLRDLLTDLGSSFIKAGQVLANRPDIVRADFMEELTKLQDDVPPVSNDLALNIVERELGKDLESCFLEISSEPIAAASLGQVYKARIRGSGDEVALKVQRPGVEPVIWRDLFLFRALGNLVNGYCLNNLGCNAQLIIDEFGRKLLEELDFTLEARNMEDFRHNFRDDATVKIPKVHKELSSRRVLTMEWINGIRATNPEAIKQSSIDVDEFIRIGVVGGMRQLLEFGLFHGDPHPGNIFALYDGRIAYVDFGNVAQLSQANKQVLIDAVVHAINEDYESMAGDFIRLGFLSPGTDVQPIIPALERIWSDSRTRSLESFNFRTVTNMFNQLVYEYPIRIPERCMNALLFPLSWRKILFDPFRWVCCLFPSHQMRAFAGIPSSYGHC